MNKLGTGPKPIQDGRNFVVDTGQEQFQARRMNSDENQFSVSRGASKANSYQFEAGMRTVKQDGIEKVLMGVTDIHQVRAVCIK